MAYQDKYNPIKNYKFVVTIIGGPEIGFQKVSGLKVTVESVTYREGNDIQTSLHKSPGMSNWDPIVLSKGLTVDETANTFFDYLEETTSPELNFRHDVTVELKGKDNSTVRTWFIPNAWISDYELGEMNAEASEVFVKTITLEHEGWKETGSEPASELTAYTG